MSVKQDKQNRSQEMEIKTIINLYNKADNQQYSELIQIIQSNPVRKDVLSYLLKRLFDNNQDTNEEMVKLIKIIMDLGVNLNIEEEMTKNTLLMAACFKGWTSVVELILQKKPDEVNRTNSQQKNCLFFAIASQRSKGNLDMIHLLLKNGANPNLKENFYGDTCFSLVVRQNNLEISSLLLQYGANPNIQVGDLGITPLHLACKNLNINLVSLLLINKANPRITNKNNETCLDLINAVIAEQEGNQVDNSETYQMSIEIRDYIQSFLKQEEIMNTRINLDLDSKLFINNANMIMDNYNSTITNSHNLNQHNAQEKDLQIRKIYTGQNQGHNSEGHANSATLFGNQENSSNNKANANNSNNSDNCNNAITKQRNTDSWISKAREELERSRIPKKYFAATQLVMNNAYNYSKNAYKHSSKISNNIDMSTIPIDLSASPKTKNNKIKQQQLGSFSK